MLALAARIPTGKAHRRRIIARAARGGWAAPAQRRRAHLLRQPGLHDPLQRRLQAWEGHELAPLLPLPVGLSLQAPQGGQRHLAAGTGGKVGVQQAGQVHCYVCHACVPAQGAGAGCTRAAGVPATPRGNKMSL